MCEMRYFKLSNTWKIFFNQSELKLASQARTFVIHSETITSPLKNFMSSFHTFLPQLPVQWIIMNFIESITGQEKWIRSCNYFCHFIKWCVSKSVSVIDKFRKMFILRKFKKRNATRTIHVWAKLTFAHNS